MATTKDAKYKVHNGTDFDTIHFETKASQVIANDGSNLETHLAEDVTQKDVIQTAEVNDSTKVPSSAVTFALDNKITELKNSETSKLYGTEANTNRTFTLPNERGVYLCAVGHGQTGVNGAGALYLINFWSTSVYGVSAINESSRYSVTVSSARVVTIETSTWCKISIVKIA